MTRGHIFGLDLIRALAVLMVLVTHASFLFVPVVTDLTAFEPWLLPGQLGVELFFVLSGFLIGGILIEEAERGALDLRRFWLRRWLRTLPNYYLFLILNLLLVRWIDGTWVDAWRYAAFLQNLAWPTPPFYQESWSLAVEEIFYLVAPLLILIGKGRIGRWLLRIGLSPVSLIVIGIVAFSIIRFFYVLQNDPGWDEGVRKVVVARLDAIAYGVLAVLVARKLRPDVSTAGWFAFGGMIGVAISAYAYLSLPRDSSLLARTLLFNLIPLSFAAFLPLAAHWKAVNLPAAIRLTVTQLALWSYALYVSHAFLLRILVGAFGWHGTTVLQCLIQATVFSVLAVAVSAMVYRFYERPWLSLREKVAPGQRIAAAEKTTEPRPAS